MLELQRSMLPTLSGQIIENECSPKRRPIFKATEFLILEDNKLGFTIAVDMKPRLHKFTAAYECDTYARLVSRTEFQ